MFTSFIHNFFSSRLYKSSWSTTVTHWFGKVHWTWFLLKGHWILWKHRRKRVLGESITGEQLELGLHLTRPRVTCPILYKYDSLVFFRLLDTWPWQRPWHAHLTRPLDTWHSALTAALTRLIGTWDSAPSLDTWHLTLGPGNGLDMSTWNVHLTLDTRPWQRPWHVHLTLDTDGTLV